MKNINKDINEISIDDLREKFLCCCLRGNETRNLRSQVTAFISFYLEWKDRSRLCRLVPTGGTSEPFFLHLFKGCLLFESLIKANQKHQTNSDTLGKALIEISSHIGIPSNIGGKCDNISEIIEDLAGQNNRSIESVIARVLKLRNTLCHDLNWNVTFNDMMYDQLAGEISIACLHIISRLYIDNNAPLLTSYPVSKPNLF